MRRADRGGRLLSVLLNRPNNIPRLMNWRGGVLYRPDKRARRELRGASDEAGATV
jgi:hypothetical protein